MSHTQAPQRKTYSAKASLEVFYTGGPCRLSHDGTMVAAACHEAVNIVEVATGKVAVLLICACDSQGSPVSHGGDPFIASVHGPAMCRTEIRDLLDGRYEPEPEPQP